MHLSWIELFGFITGAVCVLLAVRENVWNWPVGIANNIFFLVLFWRTKLYADSGLQIVYVAISLYGLWHWLYGGERHTHAKITHTTRASAALLLPAAGLAAAILYYVLSHFTDSNVPAGDAITTALSLAAQYMLGRKQIENWLVWITADVIYIGLYCYKSLYLTAVLYAVFIALCVAGYKAWERTMNDATTPATEAAEG
jgi:nicotinamide mononucleotide transporter